MVFSYQRSYGKGNYATSRQQQEGSGKVPEYANNRDQWPDKDLWDRLAKENDGNEPADHMRCQLEFGEDGPHCGLRVSDKGSRDRCLFHTPYWDRSTDAALLRDALKAHVREGADLRQSNFERPSLRDLHLGRAKLNGSVFNGTSLYKCHLREANLRWAVFKEQPADSSVVDLRGTDLRGALMLGMSLSSNTRVDGTTKWADSGSIIAEEKLARTGKHPNQLDQPEAFRQCAAIYRQIKMSYQESGDYQTAGQFFIREMECRRLALAAEGPPTEKKRGPLRQVWDWVSHYATRGVWCLSYYTCQHAENPGRLLGIMALLIFAFAFIHGACGIEDSSGNYVVGPGLELVWPPWAGLSRFGKALYFSVITFTSLGYGDVRPANGASQFVTCVKVALGVILIALFVGCIIRKVSR